MGVRIVSVVLFAVGVGCAAVVGCSSSSDDTKSQSSALSYWKDVKPIADAKCVGCHQPGGIAPFALQNYDDFVTRKGSIQDAVQSRRMPPWLASASCAEYTPNGALSDDQIAAIVNWVDQGVQAGDPAQYKPGQSVIPELQRIDSHLQMPISYTPKVKPDEYRCFVLDWTPQTEKFITGYQARPGNPAIVHHVAAYLGSPGDAHKYAEMDAADPDPGYVCFGGPDNSKDSHASMLGTWTPGGGAVTFPAGTGLRVAPGSKVIFQVHYNSSHNNTDATKAPDQSSIDFTTADQVDKPAVAMPMINPKWVFEHQMRIPARAEADFDWTFDPQNTPGLDWNTISGGLLSNDKPFNVWHSYLHMHTRGTSASISIDHTATGQRECMLDIEKWDFDWQRDYTFTQPKQIYPGDKIYLKCHFDNRPSDTERNWGEGTDDEMCMGILYLTP